MGTPKPYGSFLFQAEPATMQDAEARKNRMRRKERMVRYARKRYLLIVISAAVALATGLIGWRLYRPPPLYRITILPSLDGWRTEAYSLNDNGCIVGTVETNDGAARSILLAPIPERWDK